MIGRPIGNKERCVLWLNYAVEQDVRRFSAVEERFPDLQEAYELVQKKHHAPLAFLGDRVLSRLITAGGDGFMDRFVEMLEKKHIGVAIREHSEYPKLLLEISDPPSVLYYRGKLNPAPELALGIVGTRKPTDYGKDVARLFGHRFARAGATVISGMASGIDACAARGALDCEDSAFPTVAVLGTGVDVVYPAENRKLYEEIVCRGGVISEFLPGTQPAGFHFPIRNRIISGLSHGVVVIEAGERSGTSITVGDAHDQGREVFSVPGRITDAKSLGTNGLIRRGEAKPVCSAEDVLDEFQCLTLPLPREDAVYQSPSVSFEGLGPEEKAIVGALESGGRSFDELCEMLPIPMGLLNSFLTALEFSGIMKQLPGRIYVLNQSPSAMK